MADAAIALNANTQKTVAEALSQSLADTVVTTMLAQNFHWNVTGMGFGQLHALFQEIYEDHFAAQDELAERMRALNVPVDGSYAQMLDKSDVTEHAGKASDKDMIKALLVAQETLGSALTSAASTAAENEDMVTEDLCIGRAAVHDKFAWILRAHLA